MLWVVAALGASLVGSGCSNRLDDGEAAAAEASTCAVLQPCPPVAELLGPGSRPADHATAAGLLQLAGMPAGSELRQPYETTREAAIELTLDPSAHLTPDERRAARTLDAWLSRCRPQA